MNLIENMRCSGYVLNDFVLIAKTARGVLEKDGGRYIGGIALPELSVGVTNFVEIIDVGIDCEVFRGQHSRWGGETKAGLPVKFGETIWCPDITTDFHYAGKAYGTDLYFFREKDLLPVLIRKTGLVPLADYVVVGRAEKDERGAKGIDVPDVYQRLSPWCSVLAVGDKVSDVNVGDVAMVNAKVKTFSFSGKTFSCLRESEIDAIRC